MDEPNAAPVTPPSNPPPKTPSIVQPKSSHPSAPLFWATLCAIIPPAVAPKTAPTVSPIQNPTETAVEIKKWPVGSA